VLCRAFVLAFLFGFLSAAPGYGANNNSVASSPIRVACVGASITKGVGAPKGKSYPDQLQQILGPGWYVRNFGVSGRTMLRKGDKPYWNEKAFQAAQDFQPNVVVIMLGTNDSKPVNWVHGDDFVSDYRDMVKVFQGLASKPQVYPCHPPVVVDPNKYKISESASAIMRQRIDALAKEMGLTVIPLDQSYAGDLSVLKDGVHPNEKGALELAQTVAKALPASAAPQPVHAAN